MPRKQDPSFALKQIIWDIAGTVGTDNWSATYREINHKLEELRNKGELLEDIPEERKVRDIIELDIQRLLPEVVIAKLPSYVWHLRTDYENIRQLATENTEAKQQVQAESQTKQELNPVLTEAHKEHLNEIRGLIDEWLSGMITPEIFQVGKDYSGFLAFEHKRLFDGVKEHLPFLTFPSLWEKYDNWKAKRTEYVDECKRLRMEIRKSWRIKGICESRSFEQPVLRLLSGTDKKLEFKLFVSVGHDLAEVKYQLLDVNDTEVVSGRGIITRQFQMLEHKACSKEILPSEYQRILDHFVKSKAAAQVKHLLSDTRLLEAEVCDLLQEVQLGRAYFMYPCWLCPGSKGHQATASPS